MRLTKNNDPRNHYYIARCIHCPLWVEHCNNAPIRAERLARRHAKRKPGHQSYVINVNTLSVLYRYMFDPITVCDEDIPPY